VAIRFAQFPVAATPAHGVLLRRRSDTGVACARPAAAPLSRAGPLLAVWRFVPDTRRLEGRWMLERAASANGAVLAS
jgi:hypothetical protein